MSAQKFLFLGGLDVPIPFESPEVKALVVPLWGGETGGVTGVPGFRGEVTYRQARAIFPWVSTMGIFWNANLGGKPFNEFKFFTGVGANIIPGILHNNMFSGSGISSLIIPEGVGTFNINSTNTAVNGGYIEFPSTALSIGNNCFGGSYGYTIKIHATTPPSLGTANTGAARILVPSASVDAYKAASGWSTYASIIEGF